MTTPGRALRDALGKAAAVGKAVAEASAQVRQTVAQQQAQNVDGKGVKGSDGGGSVQTPEG